MRPSARLLDNDAYASRRQTEPACPLDEAQGTSMMTRWALRDHPDACMLYLSSPEHRPGSLLPQAYDGNVCVPFATPANLGWGAFRGWPVVGAREF
jgi:hypothetical protein